MEPVLFDLDPADDSVLWSIKKTCQRLGVCRVTVWKKLKDGDQRNRAWPQAAHTLSGPFVLGYLTGIIGTGIWGYGDLLLHLVP